MKRINALKLEDGKVTVFQRDDVKSGLWYANFQLGHGKRAMKSLETTDRTVAEYKAKDLYRKLLVRVDQDLPLRTIKFADVNRRSIGTPYRRAKGTPLALHRSIDVGRGFRAAGGVGRA